MERGWRDLRIQEVARAARRTLRRLLGPVTDRLVFINRRKVNLARSVARILPGKLATRLKGMTDTLSGALQIMNGIPNDVALSLAYWRSGALPPPDNPRTPHGTAVGSSGSHHWFQYVETTFAATPI